MKIFGVQLKAPDDSDLMAIPLCGLFGAVVGYSLLQVTHGSPYIGLAMAASVAVAGVLASCGANLDAGWRGAAVSLGGAVGAFCLTLTIIG